MRFLVCVLPACASWCVCCLHAGYYPLLDRSGGGGAAGVVRPPYYFQIPVQEPDALSGIPEYLRLLVKPAADLLMAGQQPEDVPMAELCKAGGCMSSFLMLLLLLLLVLLLALLLLGLGLLLLLARYGRTIILPMGTPHMHPAYWNECGAAPVEGWAGSWALHRAVDQHEHWVEWVG